MDILGISSFYHDSAAALLRDGVVVAAAQEERFSREKHDSSFPSEAIQFCLEYGGTTIDDLDAVVFYEKPLLKFERLLETYYEFAPNGLRSFLSAIPVWIKEKLFQKNLIRNELEKIENYDQESLNLIFSEHHLSHAASAFYPSPYDEAAILTLDAVGEWATTAISIGQGQNIEILKELHFPHSIGLLYSSFTYYLGFRVNSGEYKMMGLAPYGNPESERVKHFKEVIKSNLIQLKEDGSFYLDQEFFGYATGLKMVDENRWEDLFGFPRRTPESDLEQIHCDLALAIQEITENIVLRLARTAKKLTGMSKLCLAGGVALNCVANGKLLRKNIFDDLWIQPAAGDAGGSLGAAYASYYMHFGCEKESNTKMDHMEGSYLGPEYSEIDIQKVSRRYNAPYKYFKDFNELCHEVARFLDDGRVVGWFQGRMEWGPRALGNRSILGDPRDPETQKALNLKIKDRESFRPFAPTVLFEDTREYFDLEEASPYMLLVANVRTERRNPLPDGYHGKPLKEKLYFERSDIPAVTHLDFSARVQTVHKETNPRYWNLIKSFKDRTGYGVVVNTSFNVRGEPIVCTPEEAYQCFMRTEMDCLVMNNMVFQRSKQPEWHETKQEWRDKISLD